MTSNQFDADRALLVFNAPSYYKVHTFLDLVRYLDIGPYEVSHGARRELRDWHGGTD